jgi:hypothetical protein
MTDRKAQRNQTLELESPVGKMKRGKKEVDDDRETLHNLASLLLTNKTIRTMQQGRQICRFFKN